MAPRLEEPSGILSATVRGPVYPAQKAKHAGLCAAVQVAPTQRALADGLPPRHKLPTANNQVIAAMVESSAMSSTWPGSRRANASEATASASILLTMGDERVRGHSLDPFPAHPSPSPARTLACWCPDVHGYAPASPTAPTRASAAARGKPVADATERGAGAEGTGSGGRSIVARSATRGHEIGAMPSRRGRVGPRPMSANLSARRKFRGASTDESGADKPVRLENPAVPLPSPVLRDRVMADSVAFDLESGNKLALMGPRPRVASRNVEEFTRSRKL